MQVEHAFCPRLGKAYAAHTTYCHICISIITPLHYNYYFLLKVVNKSLKFTDYTDSHLLKVIQQQSPVLKLAFDVAVIGSEFARVDQFMELVRNTKVEELSIFVQTQDFRWCEDMFEGNLYYEFPYSFIPTYKWLQSLTIQGCKFTCNNLINNTAGMFPSLRQLCLSQVMLLSNEALSNISSCCPEIEVIEFSCCSFGITTLKLSKFPKLKKASVVDLQYGLEYVDITETNLESFQCTSTDMECLISLAACSNIRELILSSCCLIETDDNLLGDLATYFPLLEKADLQDVAPFAYSDRIKASNSHLRTLKLLFNRAIQVISVECPNLKHFKYTGYGFEEVYLNCPKLKRFDYKGSIPRLILLDLPTDVEYISFQFDLTSVHHMSWFISLRKFLEQIRGCNNNVFVHLTNSPDMVEFVLDELGAVKTFQPNCAHLEVEITNCGVDSNFSAAFVDGLIWSTLPTTLSVGGDCYDFTKHLCEKLAQKSRDKSCCDRELCNKYWWHNISDFKVEYKEEDMTHNLASLVEMCKQSSRDSHVDGLPIGFDFEWHSAERFTADLLVEMAGFNNNP
ncbi:F-box/LRR-repeat protein 7, partial [Bienertia sinuspersici]